MSTITERAAMRVTGIHQAALRCTDLRRARVFYVERLGFPLLDDAEGGFTFAVGGSAVRVLGPLAEPGDGPPPSSSAGLCRLTLGCADGATLRRAAAALTSAGIEHSDVRIDSASGKEHLTFDDPDGIGWELHVV